MLRSRMSFRSRMLVAMGGGAVFAFVIAEVASWRGAHSDVRIANMVLESNPESSHNDRRIEVAVARAMAAPSLETAPNANGDPDESRTELARTAADPEWEGLARTRFRLAATVDTLQLEASALFRNVHLNPGDQFIARHDRHAFAEWLKAQVDAVRGVHAAIQDVSVQELNFLIDHGAARSIPYATLVERGGAERVAELEKCRQELGRQLESAGATPAEIARSVAEVKVIKPQLDCVGAFGYATRAGDARVFLGDLVRMPQTRMASEAYCAAVLDLYFEIIRFFRSKGCLDETRQHALFDTIEPRLSRYLSR
jgi:hypothetical protein